MNIKETIKELLKNDFEEIDETEFWELQMNDKEMLRVDLYGEWVYFKPKAQQQKQEFPKVLTIIQDLLDEGFECYPRYKLLELQEQAIKFLDEVQGDKNG